MRHLTLILLIGLTASQGLRGDDALRPIPRRIPPVSTFKLDPAAVSSAEKELGALKQRISKLKKHSLIADADVLHKAADYALQHKEFYSARDWRAMKTIRELLVQRLDALEDGKMPWAQQRGLVVRGYYSSIDDSPQPYGLHVPENLDLSKPVPLYVWLHGRGDKITDLHFIMRRLRGAGNVHPENAITIHPFGRQCIGYKSAGEIDVLEAIAHLKTQYKIDDDRVALMGFSMGGAGAWHVGAHYADRWVAVGPGAGFAETARYNRLSKDRYPPTYEQQLWTLYDVPNYVRNLFNMPVVAYSGEKDKQIQAARVMEEAFQQQGRKLPHLIGPGMGHRYHPKTLKQLLQKIDQAVAAGRSQRPQRVHLQTRTLRYNKMRWVTLTGLEQHWRDSRVDAEITGPRKVHVKTKNARGIRLSPFAKLGGVSLTIDGQSVSTPADYRETKVELIKADGKWQIIEKMSPYLQKEHGLQGPIDDVLMAPFLVVTPSGKCRSSLVDRWVRFELEHFKSRWRSLYRGELRIKQDKDVTADDIAKYHLIVWGDSQANSVVQRILHGKGSHQLPLQWNESQVSLKGHKLAADHHVPLMIYPNPLNRRRYVVLNSGPTHREGHDRTNSLQNPKLPDWALLDLNTPPDALAPGKVIAAGFFDERWR